MKLRYNLESYNFEKFITKYFSNDNEEMKELEESYFEERKREEEDKDELVLDEDCCNNELGNSPSNQSNSNDNSKKLTETSKKIQEKHSQENEMKIEVHSISEKDYVMYKKARKYAKLISLDDENISLVICEILKSEEYKENNKYIDELCVIIVSYLELSYHITEKHAKLIVKVLKLYSCKCLVKDSLVNDCNLKEALKSTAKKETSLSYASTFNKSKVMNIMREECIRRMIQKSICYSVTTDESTMWGLIKLGVNVRMLLTDGRFFQTTLKLTNFFKNTTAMNLEQLLTELLEAMGFSLENCVSITTDGCSVMKGCNSGMCLQFCDDVKAERRKVKNSILIVNDSITCMAHRVNLCVRDFLKEPQILFINVFISWFTSLTITKRWNMVHKHKKGLCAPKISQIRWGFRSDALNFIISHVNKVDRFLKMNNNEMKKSLLRELKTSKATWLSTKKIFFDMNNKKINALMFGVRFVLRKSKKLMYKLQTSHGVITKKYHMIMKHIKWLFECLDRLEDGNPDLSKVSNKYERDYYSYMALATMGTKKINSIMYDLVQKYLNNMMSKFVTVNGLEQPDCSNITSYISFKKEIEIKNAENPTFQLMVLSRKFNRKKYRIWSKFPKKFKEEYRKFKKELSKTKYDEGTAIIDLIERFGKDKYEMMYANLKTLYCIFPTSCGVESLFSYMNNIIQPNMSDGMLEAKVNNSEEIRSDQLEKFILPEEYDKYNSTDSETVPDTEQSKEEYSF